MPRPLIEGGALFLAQVGIGLGADSGAARATNRSVGYSDAARRAALYPKVLSPQAT